MGIDREKVTSVPDTLTHDGKLYELHVTKTYRSDIKHVMDTLRDQGYEVVFKEFWVNGFGSMFAIYKSTG